MAKMIPVSIASDTESQAEIRSFELFKTNFDNSWTIFHSYRLRGENVEGKLIDSEIDFLLFNPKYGIIVLEVKGGVISYDGSGNCYQNNKKINDPEFQSRLNKYNLMKILRNRLNGDPQIKFAHAVYFPDSYIDSLCLPPAYDSIAFSGKDSPYLEKCFINLLEKIKIKRQTSLSDSISKLILEKLNPNFQIGNTILDRLEQNKRLFPVLTEIQTQLLDFINNYKKVLIQGCAGSGKTILAIKKARELALENKKVLLLCYNSLLGERLQDSVKDLDEFVDAGTYHNFCIKLLSESCFKDRIDYKSQKFWNEILPELMQELLSENKLNYDAIIIDEAQDFRYEYWLNIIEQINENTIFYVFYDSEQNIFGTDFELPFKAIPFTLKKVCRNSVSIINYIREFVDFEIKQFENSPIGEDVKVFHIKDSTSGLNDLKTSISDLIKNNKVEAQNIAILGAHSFKHTFEGESIKYSNVEIIDGSSKLKSKTDYVINYYTFMKYKGCESDVIILYDVDLTDDRWKNGIYTAASRARSLLYVFYK